MTSKAVKRTPHNYSVSRNIRQNRDNTDKALLLFGSEEVTGPSPVISSLENSLKIAVLFDKCRVFRDFLHCEYHG